MDFILREWKAEDIPNVAHYANNQKIAANLRDVFPYPYSLQDAKEYVESCISCDKTQNLFRAIVIEGKAIGSIGVFKQNDVYHKSAELGYWLAEEYWGRGIMSTAISRICRESFAQLDIIRIFAEPYAYNTGSRMALEKAGFTLEGIMKNSVIKNGTIHDSCMYALLKHLK